MNIGFTNPTLTVGVSLLAGVLSVGVGAGGAWWLHRRTRLSPRNAYLLWLACCPLVVAAAAAQSPIAIGALLWLLLASQTASLLGRRWRITALGAGGELRDHERARVMAWTALRQRGARGSERVHIASQGELVRRRGWPDQVRALPMTGDGRALLPLEEGHHHLYVGATGSGKTTSARRVLLARGLGEPSVALLALDPKGDPGLERDLRAIAAARGRPYIVFDPYAADTDRWNPIWAADPGAVVARLVAPVEADSNSDASHYSRLPGNPARATRASPALALRSHATHSVQRRRRRAPRLSPAGSRGPPMRGAARSLADSPDLDHAGLRGCPASWRCGRPTMPL